MTIIHNPEVANLPDWAQEHVKSLENKIINLERVVSVFSGDRESHIRWNDWLNNDWHNIPNSCRVQYELQTKVLAVTMELDRSSITITDRLGHEVSADSENSNVVKIS